VAGCTWDQGPGSKLESVITSEIALLSIGNISLMSRIIKMESFIPFMKKI